jgi:hypothetical protein
MSQRVYPGEPPDASVVRTRSIAVVRGLVPKCLNTQGTSAFVKLS